MDLALNNLQSLYAIKHKQPTKVPTLLETIRLFILICRTLVDGGLTPLQRNSTGRIIGFIPFPRVLVLGEMQSVSSRIWTRVAVSISYDNNHYTAGTSYYVLFNTKVILWEEQEWYYLT